MHLALRRRKGYGDSTGRTYRISLVLRSGETTSLTAGTIYEVLTVQRSDNAMRDWILQSESRDVIRARARLLADLPSS